MSQLASWVCFAGLVGLLAFVVAVVAVDMVAAHSGDATATVTWAAREAAIRFPLALFLAGLSLGLVLGHLFWE